MFFDLGWSELLLIGAVALVVIGPKELPNALRIAGFWVRKARSLSREFQSSVEQMMREAELDEMRKELKKATEFDVEKEFQKTIDPTGDLQRSIAAPEIPDHFEPPPGSAGEAAEGTPVIEDPAEIVGFDEPGAAETAIPSAPAADDPVAPKP